jgi:hypothetical protein
LANDKQFIPFLVDSFHENSLSKLADIIVNLWGDSTFVNKGNSDFQEFLTETILYILNKFDSASLMCKNNTNETPLIVSLSQGVSTYLDAGDKQSRLNGMKVAKAFSGILGNSIHFDELENDEKESLPNKTDLFQAKEEKVSNRVLNKDSSEDFSDSDSDSLESYHSEESEVAELVANKCIDIESVDTALYKKEIKATKYLRECLQSKLITFIAFRVKAKSII